MRARLQKYLPVFLFALLVQIIAPIGLSWAAAAAASNPLGVAEICHGSPSSTGSGEGGQYHDHDASCVLCCGFMANAAPGASSEPAGFVAPVRFAGSVVWRDGAPQLATSRTGSNAKARAPPSVS
ncbi:MAG: DUF2946 family protein [Bradyrhizobium sp.]|nr:DUF2946 family protein [Bradyrhizobium sp.]